MQMPNDRSPRKARGHGSERREEILAAAAGLFARLGVSGVSTRQIALAVGISQPTLYAYFKTKDDIAEELYSRAFALLAARLAEQDMGPAQDADDVVRMLRVYVDFGLEHPDLYRLAFMTEALGQHPVRGQQLSPATQSTYGVLRGHMADIIRRGLALPAEVEVLTQSVWSAMHGLVALMIAKPGFPWADRETLIQAHLRLVARGALRPLSTPPD